MGSAVATALTYSRKKKSAGDSAKKEDTDSLTKDLQRSLEAGKQHRVSFLTEIIEELWDYLNIAGADTIRATLEPMLSEMRPAILVSKMDLGKVPPRLDNIVVHKINKDVGYLKFDMDVVWDGQCDIQLKANYIGSFGVKAMKLKGRMSVLLKPLTNQLPVVSAIQYAFINPPALKLEFTGLAQVADLHVIHDSIYKIINDTMAGMIVLPNRMLYKMVLSNNFLDTYHAPLGIARITLIGGSGFVEEQRSLRAPDVPDVYCLTTVGCSDEWKTSTIKNSMSPEWKESADFLFTDHQQLVQIEAWDEDAGALDPDDFLGQTKVSVGELLLRGRTMDTKLVDKEGKETGAVLTLSCELSEWTTDLQSFGRNAAEHNTLCGLLTIIVTQAFAIPVERVEAASYVKITYGTREFFTSQVSHYPGIGTFDNVRVRGCKRSCRLNAHMLALSLALPDAINPEYDCAFHVPLTPKLIQEDNDVIFSLYNSEDLLGTFSVSMSSLKTAPEKTLTERRPIGTQGASLEFRCTLRGIQETVSHVTLPSVPSMEVEGAVTSRSVPEEKPNVPKPIGTVRITAVRGRGFKIQKRHFRKDDIPDLYCNVKFDSDDYLWRTTTKRNTTTPEWNESADFVLMNHNQMIDLDLFEEDRKSITGDEEMGNITITVGELLLAGGESELEIKKGKASGAFLTLRCDVVEAGPVKE